jgi:hypothetical protein
MIAIVVWSLVIYGMSNILVYGSILNGFRNTIERWGNNPSTPFNKVFHFIREMLRCMLCTPTWLGFFFGFLIYSPTYTYLNVSEYYSWFLDGTLASGTTWIINSIIEWFEENRPNHNENINNNQIL